MEFESTDAYEKTGMYLGFLVSYLIFTTILYGLLYFLKKLPLSWSFVHIGSITLVIASVGLIIRWLLK
ncbi:hypothetical protein HYY69_05245 [Candidatus Woesearchaeota archaeon]|nr:hypothetical protein [Candidatus Woesearchaeota archaeon]